MAEHFVPIPSELPGTSEKLFAEVLKQLESAQSNGKRSPGTAGDQVWLADYACILRCWGVDAHTYEGSLRDLGEEVEDLLQKPLRLIHNRIKSISAAQERAAEEKPDTGGDLIAHELREELDDVVLDLRQFTELVLMTFAERQNMGPLMDLRKRSERIPYEKLGKVMSGSPDLTDDKMLSAVEEATQQTASRGEEAIGSGSEGPARISATWADPTVMEEGEDKRSTNGQRRQRQEIEVGSEVWWKDPDRALVHRCRVAHILKDPVVGCRYLIDVPGRERHHAVVPLEELHGSGDRAYYSTRTRRARSLSETSLDTNSGEDNGVGPEAGEGVYVF